MKKEIKTGVYFFVVMLLCSCMNKSKKESNIDSGKQLSMVNAKEILGNPNYLAISYGGYRKNTRDIGPTIDELKEDMKILSAMGIKILRTYNVQLQQAPNLLKAISQLRKENPEFEMYVMLGAWIDCKNAWTDKTPDHSEESKANEAEIARAVALANQHPDIVKIIAVGNEAMVKWATSYYVQPKVILKWVNHLQDLKIAGELSKDLWITSSDDFASWGGGDNSYHTEDLEKLIKAVDYISMHTYPFHNSHYNSDFWVVPENEENLTNIEKIDAAMLRATEFAKDQYDSVSNYLKRLGVDTPIHIGETGWASVSNGLYGPTGSRAADEYKEGAYYSQIRNWTNKAGISCFYFEAFDEQWKDAQNTEGSENHFGLFTINGQAKYALWQLVDKHAFDGLTRNGMPITTTYNSAKEALMKDLMAPPTTSDINTTN